jgi:excisionase family DNA binding protein
MKPITMLISASEAATLLGVNSRTIRRRIERGDFQAVTKFPGLRSPYILNRDEVMNLVGKK